MELFFSAIGLLLIFEGLPYFINPEGMQKMAELMRDANPGTLRTGGFLLMITGLMILYVFSSS